MCFRERTDSQVGDEEVGDGAKRFEAIDDVDDQRITQNPQHDDGAVGQDQHHLRTTAANGSVERKRLSDGGDLGRRFTRVPDTELLAHNVHCV